MIGTADIVANPEQGIQLKRLLVACGNSLENRFLEFLDSGRPLTISAEGKSYVLPPVNAPRWRARYQKIC